MRKIVILATAGALAAGPAVRAQPAAPAPVDLPFLEVPPPAETAPAPGPTLAPAADAKKPPAKPGLAEAAGSTVGGVLASAAGTAAGGPLGGAAAGFVGNKVGGGLVRGVKKAFGGKKKPDVGPAEQAAPPPAPDQPN